MRITATDWKSVGLNGSMVSGALNLSKASVYQLGKQPPGRMTVQRLKSLVTTFPEKRKQLLILFEERLGNEAVRKIVEFEEEGRNSTTHENYEAKFYQVVFKHMQVCYGDSSGIESDFVSNIKNAASDLDIPVDTVLEAIKRNIL